MTESTDVTSRPTDPSVATGVGGFVPDQAAVEAVLRSGVDRLDPTSRHVAGYHLGFWDAHGTAAAGAGKQLRGRLALLSARAAGRPGCGVAAAAAVELVHNFSLLHDDVMDGDTDRRHRPTAWSVFGRGPAILAGDALLALAAEVLADDAAPGSLALAIRCVTATTRRLIGGQTADLSFERRADVDLEECLAMAGDKTGALLACSASLGAVLAEAPPQLVIGLEQYGERLGLAFQLVDDLLGLWGDPATTGKPVLSDLAAGKKTLPIVAAMTSGTAAGEQLREVYADGRQLAPDQVERAAQLVDAAGGRTWAEAEASRQRADALKVLDDLDLPEQVRRELGELTRFVRKRDH